MAGLYSEDECMRSKGSRNTLIRINYDTIGFLAGLAGDTAKQYAHRGEYDPRNLENVLRWVNGRRVAKGLPLIGLPSVNATDAENCSDGIKHESYACTASAGFVGWLRSAARGLSR